MFNRKQRRAVAGPPVGGWVALPRVMPKRSRWRDRCGFYETRWRGHWSSTAQARILCTATSRAARRVDGIPIGLNKITNEVEVIDPFALYGREGDDGLTGINVVIVADIGKGKSALAKSGYVLRPVVLYRQTIILDVKMQAGTGVGEYTPIATDLGAASIRFIAGGGGACINLLDPVMSGTTEASIPGVVPKGQQALVQAVLAADLGRPLKARERGALRCALEAVHRLAEAEGRDPLPADLRDRLLDPQPGDMDSLKGRWSGRAQDWGRDLGIALDGLINGPLKGLVDEATSPDVVEALQTHPLVHFDLSALPTDGPALAIVMTVINTWISNRLVQRSSRFEQTLVVVEEGWRIARGELGRVFHSDSKLSRALLKSTVALFQHPSDVDPSSPAYALMREASIAIIGTQSNADDAKAIVEMFRFPPGTEDTLMTLPRGHYLCKVGGREPFLLEHVLSPQERAWTDTDTAVMQGAAA